MRNRAPSDRGNPDKRQSRKLAWKIIRVFLITVLVIHVAFIGITSALIFVYKFANPPTTVLMLYRSIVNGWKIQKPIPLKTQQIPLNLRRMLVSVEDGKFYEHHGIDMEAFKRARELNKKVGFPMYGGSTITMQVARTLFLVPDKSYIRKYFEVITAMELEIILSKNRILELYFGYAEWGKGIFGIERASKVYFGKGISGIQTDEMAKLIALLSSPIKYTPATMYRSLILRQRYEFLVRRYVAPVPTAAIAAENPPPAGIEPSADISITEEAPSDFEGSPPIEAPSSEQMPAVSETLAVPENP
jgi:membrane peptidoglycan carboxypeptidase